MEASEAGRYWESNAETWTRHVRSGYDRAAIHALAHPPV